MTLDGNNLYAETRQYVDRFLFTLVLERTRGNHRAAAQLLGISRQTMRGKLRALGISVAHSMSSTTTPDRYARSASNVRVRVSSSNSEHIDSSRLTSSVQLSTSCRMAESSRVKASAPAMVEKPPRVPYRRCAASLRRGKSRSPSADRTRAS